LTFSRCSPCIQHQIFTSNFWICNFLYLFLEALNNTNRFNPLLLHGHFNPFKLSYRFCKPMMLRGMRLPCFGIQKSSLKQTPLVRRQLIQTAQKYRARLFNPSEETITNRSQLIYPPDESCVPYRGRCNEWGKIVFYGADNPFSPISEQETRDKSR
jgi:hypothetical protein